VVHDVLAANLWAQKTYQEYFSKRPLLVPGSVPGGEDSHYICAIPPLQGVP